MPTTPPANPADVQKRIVRKLKGAQTQHQIMELLEKNFDAAVCEEGLVINLAQRRRWLTQISRSLLEEMLTKLAARKSAKK